MTNKTPSTNPTDIQSERKIFYNHEVKDFMRTGDDTILNRIIFRLFIDSPTPKEFKKDKAFSILFILGNTKHLIIQP